MKFKEVIHDGVNVDINVSSPLSEIELDIHLTTAIQGVRTLLYVLLSIGCRREKELGSLDLETIYWLNYLISQSELLNNIYEIFIGKI